jgi:hypothetical protein
MTPMRLIATLRPGEIVTMSTATLKADEMAGKAQKTTPVRLTDEAIRWARIASGYTGESMAEYVSRIVEEHARDDAERLHAEATGEKPKGRRGADG